MTRMRPTRRMEELPIDTLVRIARVVGPSSAAARALKEINERRARGEENIACYRYGATLLVGPRVDE